jgi:hypothetical protein
MIEIDFKKLHREGTLDSFIEELKDLTLKQQEAIDKYKDRKFLAPIIQNLQKKVDRWHTIVETAEAFQKKFRSDKK